VSALIAAPPTQTGAKPGVVVACGDSLTQPFPAQVSTAGWWSQLNVPLKGQLPTVRAIFGGGWDNITTPSSLTIINGAFDATAPWNLCIAWCGTNDLATGTTPAATYAKAQTFAASINPGFHLLYITTIPRSGLSQATINAYNALLLAPPFVGAGVVAGSAPIDLTPLNGNPLVTSDTTLYSDGIHLTRLGQGPIITFPSAFSLVANINTAVRGYLAGLP